MLSRIRTITRRDTGASAVEYGVLVMAIAAAVVAIVFLLGNVVTDMFTDTCEDITGAVGEGECTSTPTG